MHWLCHQPSKTYNFECVKAQRKKNQMHQCMMIAQVSVSERYVIMCTFADCWFMHNECLFYAVIKCFGELIVGCILVTDNNFNEWASITFEFCQL